MPKELFIGYISFMDNPRHTPSGIAVYKKGDEGKPTIIIPGGPGLSSALYRRFLNPAKGESMIFWDYANVGNSQKKDKISFVQDYQDLLEVISTLKLSNYSILAHSYGGTLGLKLAIEYPENVERLFLVGTASFFQPVLQEIRERKTMRLNKDEYNKLIGIYDKLARNTATADDFREFCELEAQCHFLKATPEMKRQFAEESGLNLAVLARNTDWVGIDFTKDLGKIKAQTTVVISDHDIVVPSRFSKVLSEKIPGAQTVTFNDTGHWPFAEAPGKFTKILNGHSAN